MDTSHFKRAYQQIPKLRAAAIGAPVLVLAFALYSFAPSHSGVSTSLHTGVATSPSKNFANVGIKNFGQMDDNFYRGAQPKEDEYKELAGLGIKAVIDLRDDPMPYASTAAEAVKIHYFNLPMSDKEYPKEETIEQFFTVTKEETNRPFYVHCAGGRHRTGVIGALYRFNNDGWDYSQAYQEMKNYDFYTRWGHSEMKKFVEDYWQHFKTKKNEQNAATATATKSG